LQMVRSFFVQRETRSQVLFASFAGDVMLSRYQAPRLNSFAAC
jgi:hypothetical protein